MAVDHPFARIDTAAPTLTGRDWRRLVTRSGPILAVVVAMAIVSAIAVYIYDANRRGAVSLSNDLLNAIDRRITVQMGAFLAPAEQFVEAARVIGGTRGALEAAPLVE